MSYFFAFVFVSVFLGMYLLFKKYAKGNDNKEDN